jgi:uncharacterized membrane protein
MPALSVGDCIRYAWETFKQRPWILIGGFLLAIVISSIPGLFGHHPEVGPDGKIIPHPVTVLEVIASLVSVVVSIFVSIGLTTFALRAHDNIQAVSLGDLWNPAPFWRFLVAFLLMMLATALVVGAGLLIAALFPPALYVIIPALVVLLGIASLGLNFVPYLIVDRGLGPVQAIYESWRITDGYKWQLLVLALALIGINMLGILALIVGLFVAAPISLIALAHAYRTLAR